ncbi:MAG: hypothetical protein WC506_02480 [Candidatus Micrarchaeia archaeon]
MAGQAQRNRDEEAQRRAFAAEMPKTGTVANEKLKSVPVRAMDTENAQLKSEMDKLARELRKFGGPVISIA